MSNFEICQRLLLAMTQQHLSCFFLLLSIEGSKVVSSSSSSSSCCFPPSRRNLKLIQSQQSAVWSRLQSMSNNNKTSLMLLLLLFRRQPDMDLFWSIFFIQFKPSSTCTDHQASRQALLHAAHCLLSFSALLSFAVTDLTRRRRRGRRRQHNHRRRPPHVCVSSRPEQNRSHYQK